MRIGRKNKKTESIKTVQTVLRETRNNSPIFSRFAVRHTDVAHYARVIGVVAAVCRQVECHRQTLLSGSQVAAIECVGLFGRRETGVLADGPGTHHVHRRIGAAEERCDTCRIVQVPPSPPSSFPSAVWLKYHIKNDFNSIFFQFADQTL